MRSAALQRAYRIAEKIDKHVSENGLKPLIEDGHHRFDFTVLAYHEEGTQFIFCHAYCVIWNEWLIIVPEHHAVVVLATDDLTTWSMQQQVDVPNIHVKGNAVVIKDESLT